MQVLRRPISWIEPLPGPLRLAIERRWRPTLLADGEAVYSAGEAGNECFVVRSGRVRMTDYSSGGREFQVMDCLPGDAFGELSLLDGQPRAENAYAHGPTELLVLSAADFEDLRSQFPALERHLCRYLCARLRALSEDVKEASTLTLADRLPRLLLRLATRHGGPSSEAVVLIEDVSHGDLANMLGVTRQSVSRELKALEQSRLIELRYRRILLPDLTALIEHSGIERSRDARNVEPD